MTVGGLATNGGPAVVTPHVLIDIALQPLAGDVVMGASGGSLEVCPKPFDLLGVDEAVHVTPGTYLLSRDNPRHV